MARFGASRTSVREALKVLAAEGTLQLLPHRGAIVARMTEAEVEEFLPVMAALEQTAGELACRRASDEEIARFRAMHEEMLAHYEAREEAPYLRLNRALHEALFEMADNATLSAMYQQLLSRIHAFRFIVRKRQRDWEDAVEDHRHILAALEARDGSQLGAILKEHVAGTTTRIARDSLEQDVPGETAAG